MNNIITHLNFLSQWIVANSIGEMLGLGVVFAVGVVIAGLFGAPHTIFEISLFAILVIILAVYEGAVVGYAQWRVLQKYIREITSREWILATVAGAVIAWILGMIPSTLSSYGDTGSTPATEPSMVMVMVLASCMGAILGVILAAAQWWVLRKYISRSLLWLLANAIAWAVGMPLIFWLVGETIGSSQSIQSVGMLIVGIGFAGAVVGSIHGLFLVRLLSSRNVESSSQS